MAERLILHLMDFKFFTSMEQPWHCPRCCSHLSESATFSSPSKENEFPFRAGRAHPAFGAKRLEHRDAHRVVERRSAGPRLDDDLAFHVGVDRAQLVIVARGCKSERKCGLLGEH